MIAAMLLGLLSVAALGTMGVTAFRLFQPIRNGYSHGDFRGGEPLL